MKLKTDKKCAGADDICEMVLLIIGLFIGGSLLFIHIGERIDICIHPNVNETNFELNTSCWQIENLLENENFTYQIKSIHTLRYKEKSKCIEYGAGTTYEYFNREDYVNYYLLNCLEQAKTMN